MLADQKILVGTVTWQFDPKFDTAFDESDLALLPPVTRHDFLKHAYFDHSLKKFVMCFDNQRFINHSDTPNIISTPQRDMAGRDIEPGEEMTCDYAQYEHDWFERRNLRREDFV